MQLSACKPENRSRCATLSGILHAKQYPGRCLQMGTKVMRGSVVLAGAIASSLMSVASAQEPDVTALQMKACTLINDEAARVRCYDQAMSRPASEPRLVTIPPSTGSGSDVPLVAVPQQVTTARPDAAAETAAVAPAESPSPAKPESPGGFDARAILQSILPSGPSNPSSTTKSGNWQVGADKSALPEASRLVGKLDSADEASLVLQCKDKNTEAYVSTKSFLGWETMRVVYRLNDNPAIEERWAAAADGRGAVARNAVEFINSLTDGATLSVRVTDYNGSDHNLRFNLGGVTNLRSQIALVCRWPGAVPEEKLAVQQAPPSKRGAKSKPAAAAPISAPLKLH
jgi:Type VI secretion system VasI, EvfG, VC_A0118